MSRRNTKKALSLLFQHTGRDLVVGQHVLAVPPSFDLLVQVSAKGLRMSLV